MIDIVIPVFNEAENIAAQLTAIGEKIRTSLRVRIIYDFPEDNTLPAVESIRESLPYTVELVQNKHGKGVLNAIRTGLECAEAEYVLVLMADLSDSLESVDRMYQKMTEEHADLVCGSRYMRGGKQTGGPRVKGLLSRAAGLSLHTLTGIPTHDISNSFKLYRNDLLRKITIESDGGFEIGMEITVKTYCAGYKIAEVPAEWSDRTNGTSRFRLSRWLPKYLRWYFYCLSHHRKAGKI